MKCTNAKIQDSSNRKQKFIFRIIVKKSKLNVLKKFELMRKTTTVSRATQLKKVIYTILSKIKLQGEKQNE